MKKLILGIMLILGAASATATQYSKSDSIKVVRLLQEAKKRNLKTKQGCIQFFTRQFFGIPYVASTLEVNKTEQLVVNLRQLDCTTYVENVVALTLCASRGTASFGDFCRNLRLIRYQKNAPISYPARLHYFTAWIQSNAAAGICTDIQSPNPPFTAVQHVSVDYMTLHSDKYPMLHGNAANLKGISALEKSISGKSFRYIPKQRIDNSRLLRQTVHNGDIIVILTSKKGLDTQHLGFAQWRPDGLHLVNASSIHKKVVEEPMLLRTYLQKHKSMTGIRIVRMK